MHNWQKATNVKCATKPPFHKDSSRGFKELRSDTINKPMYPVQQRLHITITTTQKRGDYMNKENKLNTQP